MNGKTLILVLIAVSLLVVAGTYYQYTRSLEDEEDIEKVEKGGDGGEDEEGDGGDGEDGDGTGDDGTTTDDQGTGNDTGQGQGQGQPAPWYEFVSEGNSSDIVEGKGMFNITTYPRVDGSTSAHPLQMLVACKLLNMSYRWTKSLWDDTRRIYPNSSEEGKENLSSSINNNVDHHGTHGGYVNLINNSADFILVAREPSGDELEFAGNLSVELDVTPVALDAFVFILNKTNPMADLSLKQIQDIYTGDITNWTEVGGPPANITAYQRDRNSGSQELMEKLVMKDLEMIEGPDAVVAYGMIGPINRLSEDVNGIGYSVYYYEEFMAPNEHIKLMGVDGVVPSYETIQSGVYSLSTEVYAVIRADSAEDSPEYKLREWMLTEEGQSVVWQSGYVPLAETA